MSSLLLITQYSPDCYYSGQIIKISDGFKVIITNDTNGKITNECKYSDYDDATKYMNEILAKIDKLYYRNR